MESTRLWGAGQWLPGLASHETWGGFSFCTPQIPLQAASTALLLEPRRYFFNKISPGAYLSRLLVWNVCSPGLVIEPSWVGDSQPNHEGWGVLQQHRLLGGPK